MRDRVVTIDAQRNQNVRRGVGHQCLFKRRYEILNERFISNIDILQLLLHNKKSAFGRGRVFQIMTLP